MDEVEAWLRTLTEDILVVDRIHDNVTRAKFQPCQKSVAQAVEPDLRRPLETYAETLAEFDEANNRITLYPLNTRPGAKFLQPKYPTLNHVTVEMDIQVAVDTQEDAETAFASLPDGFIRDWRWGLGIHRLFEPIFHIVRKTEIRPGDDPLDAAFQTPGWGRSLRLSRWSPTHIRPMEYVLHLSDYNRLRLGLQRIQNDHRERALSERLALTHNTLLSDLDPDTYLRVALRDRGPSAAGLDLQRGRRRPQQFSAYSRVHRRWRQRSGSACPWGRLQWPCAQACCRRGARPGTRTRRFGAGCIDRAS